MLKLSVFTVMLPDLTPEDAAPALKTSGYAGVEWRVTTVSPDRRTEAPSFWGNNLCTLEPTLDQAGRAKQIAQSAGLVINALGTYIEVGDLAAVDNAMRFAQVCGSPAIRVNPGRWPDPDGLSYPQSFERARTFLEHVQELGKRYGVKSVVETHHFTITPSASLAHRLVSAFDPDYVGVLHDAGNMVMEGYEAYRMAFELLGPYLAHVHVKNARYTRPDGGGVWKGGWAPLEDGVVNWEELFTALRGVGYQGWVAVEDFSQARPTREALAFNSSFLRGYLERIYG